MDTPCIEILLAGPRDVAKSFVLGFVRGRGSTHPLVDLEHEGFDCETLRERLGEFLRPGHSISHLLVFADDVPHVRAAVDELESQQLPTKVVGERTIAEARFTYEVQVFSPELADRIRRLFDGLPTGVHVEPEHEFEEERNEADEGRSLYAPVHAYRFRGKGIVHGSPFQVAAFWRTCLQEEAIQVNDAVVVEAESPS